MSRSRAALTCALLLASACTLQEVDLDDERPLALRTTITAADGTFLSRLFKENRALVPLDDVPDALVDAVLAAEDARFYKHPGYDLRAIARAAVANITEGSVVQGGSTITQQYVKNTFFRRPAQTFERKARELRLAIEVERRYSKDEILERYLNTVYFGEGAYGVKTAAENFFGERVSDIDTDQAALLAAVIKAPALYDPRDHPKAATARRNYVLKRMVELGYLEQAEARKLRKRKLGVISTPPRLATKQPYFVEAVKREIMSDPRFGRNADVREQALYKGGLQIVTTLQPEIQAAAEGAVTTILDQPGDPEAALVAIDPKTGKIVAMVGGRDWDVSQVNLALGKQGGGSGRQPGSSFKPIAAAAALEAGIDLDALYESAPGIFHLDDGSTWTVRNSEGTSGGLIPLDEAMVRSINGVYARLALNLGPARIVDQAEAMGVEARLPTYPSIALGSMEVSVLDMAAAYSTLAGYGTAIEPTTIERVRLPDGRVFEPEQDRQDFIVSPGNAYLLTKVLEQVIHRGTGRAADIGRPAAGKTGTTNDYADAWFVGYTPDLVAAVWVGYPEGRIPMTSVHGLRVTGGSFPALIWRQFMQTALDGVEPSRFELPEADLVTVEIDPVTGLLAAPWCPGEPRRMLRQLAPTETCPPPPTPTPEEPSPVETDVRGERGGREPTPEPSGRGRDGGNDRTPSPEREPESTPTD